MTVEQMRGAIMRVYDTQSWKKKVLTMYDDQVIAIYYDFSNRGILNKIMKKERPIVADNTQPKVKCQQLSFFDILN